MNILEARNSLTNTSSLLNESDYLNVTGLVASEFLTAKAAVQTAQNILQKFTFSSDFDTKIKTAFGDSFNSTIVNALAQAWAKEDFSSFPEIEIRSASEINGANGAFAASTNKIYLSQELVHQGDVEAIASVLLEEYGHYIDSQINAIDSTGDEGEIFADIAQGKELSESKVSALKAENDAATIILDGKTIGIEQSNSNIQVTITAPRATRPNRIGEVTVTYTNVGQTDTAAPLLTLSANGALLQSQNSGFTEERVQFLGINNQGAAGILPPGASGSFKLSFLATGEVGKDINFSASIAQENAIIDWNAIKNDARPETVPADAWDVIWNNFTGSVGNTAGQYQAVLAENATRLSQLGDYSNDVSRLLAFELEQAGNYGSIPQRYNIGSLGRGWTFPFEISVTTDSDGNAIVETSGILRFFTKQSGGGYLSQPGDEATLTQVGDTFQLREQGGTLVAFRPDGKLDFIEDTNSNRVTANYTGNQLTSIISTNGDSLNFSYNAQGRISQIVDRTGRTTTYSYDPTGELLLSITDPAGTTSYTYDVGNVLRSVTFPDGTQTLYEYDAQGRVIKQSLNGGAEAITFEYDSAGGVTVIDATGNRTALLLNDLGQIGLAQDSLGRTSQFRYNADGNLTQQIAPGNITSTFTYDDRSNLFNQVDPLRNQVNFTYDPTFDQLQSVRDQRGNVTNYNYDEKGNLVAIEYAPKTNQLLSYERGNLTGLINGRTIGRLESIQNTNGTNPVVSYYQKNGNLATTNVFFPIESIKEQFNYDLRGNLVKYVNRRGQGIEYTYDERDRLIKQTNPNGSQTNFTYDNRDNLISATDAKGTITQEFDSADRLTKITYPNGRFLQYSYDAGGRRIRMVDQDGFAVNYSYDVVGRLAGLTDGNGQRIVAYTYDNVGRLSREDNGNGTSTTYGYDAVGQLLNIVNFSPSGEINSRFDYTYDNLGRRTSMTTLEGTFNYGYDVNGQLTSVTLPNGRIIQYQYDVAGNRIAVNDNGALTSYNTNNLNQYTTVGGGNYTYDTDGNLIAKTEGGKSWTYSYDAENRLVSAVTPEGSWSYEYDAFGNRIASTQNGQRTEYLLDPTGLGDVVGEYSNGSLIARYTHGLGLESRVDTTNATAYYDFDAIGSTAGLTGGNGSYVNRYSYLPFGEDLNKVEAVSNPFEFVGQFGVMDEGNGLDFMRARYYDTSVGRFTAVDPLGLGGGNSNLYTYTFNTPTNTIDPQGTNPVVVAIGAGAVIGGVTNAVIYSVIAGSTNSFSWRGLEGAASSGAVFGAVAAGIEALAAVGAISGLAVTALSATAGGVSNGIGYLVEYGGTGKGNFAGFLASVETGIVTGGIVPSLIGYKYVTKLGKAVTPSGAVNATRNPSFGTIAGFLNAIKPLTKQKFGSAFQKGLGLGNLIGGVANPVVA
ncbi:MAG: RHS repeat-associated core domain-containing protein, partial [Phormidium sp.]